MPVRYLQPPKPFRPEPPAPKPKEAWEIETQAEIQTREKIKQLLMKEQELRNRAGNLVLAEKFITDKPHSESPEFVAYEKAKREIEELFQKDADAQGRGNMTGTYAAAARKLLRDLPRLEAAALKTRRLYDLGNQCFKVRQEIKANEMVRDRLRAERLAGH